MNIFHDGYASLTHDRHLFIFIFSIIQSRWTPLLYACNSGHPEIIKILLSQNARVDVFDDVSEKLPNQP